MILVNLFINSPAYYTREYGVIDEIYDMCAMISHGIDITLYTDALDTIGIVPIIAPTQELQSGKFNETKRISITYRMADISLVINYESFCNADISMKKQMIVDNILRSLSVVKRRLKERFDYERIKHDIIDLIDTKS